MAITGNLSATNEDNGYGIDFNGVYYKIDDLLVETMMEEIRVGVRGYGSRTARETKSMGIYKKKFIIPFSNLIIKSFSKNDILSAIYDYLKTLPDFTGMTDC